MFDEDPKIDSRITEIRYFARVIANIMYGYQCEFQRRNASGEAYCVVGQTIRDDAPFVCRYLGDETVAVIRSPFSRELKERLMEAANELPPSLEAEITRELFDELPEEIDVEMKCKCSYTPENEGYKFEKNITIL